jgi:hypothetical protein
MSELTESSAVESSSSATNETNATNESLSQVTESTPVASEVQAEKAEPKTLFETVKAAMNATKDADGEDTGEAEQSPGSEGEKAGESQDDAPDTDAPKDADGKQGKGKGRDQRIEQLLHERDSFKERATNWDQFSAWAKDSGLVADELSQSLAIARMVKNAPHEALVALREVVTSLEKVTGYVLPEDLADKVERGLVDEETARELSVGRSRVAMTEQQRRQEAEQRALQAEFDGRAHLAQSIGKSVTEYEKSLEQTDPDYQKIKGLVKSKVVELMHEDGVPTNAEAAVGQVKKAVAEIKSQLAGVIPQRRSTRQAPTGSTHGNSGARPSSSLEAARMALNGQAPKY